MLFKLYFDAHRKDGLIWNIEIGHNILNVRHVQLNGVKVATKYRGKDSEQPKAYIYGNARGHLS